jgi:hypothetical protein
MSTEHNESAEDEIRIFVGDKTGPADYVGFFEDDGETGYLYVSDKKTNQVIKHVQIYDNARQLDLGEADVQVVWSSDGKKCGVVIWGGIRGIIDLARGIEGRAKIVSRVTPPITDSQWLSGFDVK